MPNSSVARSLHETIQMHRCLQGKEACVNARRRKAGSGEAADKQSAPFFPTLLSH
jgi:hypothetical protein